MYETYWQLDGKPFDDAPDARFYYPGQAHQAALLKLRYALENGGGAGVLCGGPGTGKTLLIRSVIRLLPERFSPRAHVVFPLPEPDQLLAGVADALTGHPSAGTPTPHQSLRNIQSVVLEAARKDRRVLLVVDEAHTLCGPQSLDIVRMLLNLVGPTGTSGIALVLVGQMPLLSAIQRMPGLDERLGVKCVLRALDLEETISYVNHRLSAAGSKRPIFEPAALEAIHELTGGVPRRINRLGDLALLIGYAEERKTLSAEHIEAVSQEMINVAAE